MGNTRDTGYLQNLLTYDVDGNIVLPANLTVNGNLLVATQSYVTTQINNLINGAPALLDTLDELAAALGDDANFASTITTSIAGKQAQLNGTGFVKVTGTTVSYDNTSYLPLSGGTLTGPLNGTSSSFSSTVTAANNYLINNATASKKGYTFQSPASNWGPQLSGLYFTPNNSVDAKTTFTVELWNGLGSIITPLTIADTGAATFSSNVTANGLNALGSTLNNGNAIRLYRAGLVEMAYIGWTNENTNNSTWYFKSSNGNPIGFSANGSTQQLTIETSGNVGIGTDSPSTTLNIGHANHGIGISYIPNSSLPSIAGIFTNTSFGQQGYGSLLVKSRSDYAGYSISFYTAGTANVIEERVRIASGGNVGIGGAFSPSRLLHILAPTGNHAYQRIEGGSGGYGGFLELMANSVGSGTDSAGRIDFYMTSTNRIASIDAKRSVGGANYGNLIFSVADNSSSPTEAMRITNVRNILIGTESDTGQRFQVNGNSRFTNSAAGSASVSTNNTNTSDDAAMSNLNFDGNRLRLGVLASDSAYGCIGTNGGSTGLAFVTHNGTSWGERMRIVLGGTIYSRFGQSGTTARLDITPNLVLEGQSGVSSGRSGISLLSNGAAYGIIMFGSSTVTNTDGFIQYLNDTRQMVFGTADGARVWINSSGNVGINNNNPSHRLHVSGNIYCTDTVYGRNILPDPWAYVTAGSPSGAPIPQGYSAIEVNSPCDNVWRPVLSNINDSKVFMWVTLGDASSKDTASYTWQMTSVAYGVANMTNLTYMDGGWNTGGFEFTYDTSGNNYRLLVRSTSYYSSGNTANGKIYFLRLQ